MRNMQDVDFSQRPDELLRWLTYRRLLDCTCLFGIRSLGRLYGLDMGEGWVRTSTEPNCPQHGHWSPRERRAAIRRTNREEWRP